MSFPLHPQCKSKQKKWAKEAVQQTGSTLSASCVFLKGAADYYCDKMKM